MVSETQNNKASSNQSINNSLRGNQTDLKDTNFEYEDNEWDIGGWRVDEFPTFSINDYYYLAQELEI